MKNTIRQLISPEDQSGMASITISFIFMIVVTLIVLGFSAISRTELRNSLDRQLSTQAYYAAESGVNDALAAINNGFLNPATDPNFANTGKNTCGIAHGGLLTEGAYFNQNATLNNPANVGYTCLLVNPYPDSLSYENIDTDHSTVIPIESVDPANTDNPEDPGNLKMSWQQSSTTISPPYQYTGCGAVTGSSWYTSSSLPVNSSATWPASCYAGVIQVDIFPESIFNNPNTVRSNWTSQAITFYLRPVTSGGVSSPVAYSSLTEGKVVPVTCTTPAPSQMGCNFSISGLSNPYWYYARLRSFYVPNSVSVSASSGAKFKGAQVVIDSTGEAQDILRRVVVHAPLSLNNDNLPEYAIQSTRTICKLFSVDSVNSAPVLDSTSVPSNTDSTACQF